MDLGLVTGQINVKRWGIAPPLLDISDSSALCCQTARLCRLRVHDAPDDHRRNTHLHWRAS